MGKTAKKGREVKSETDGGSGQFPRIPCLKSSQPGLPSSVTFHV